jgi:KTSC domain
MTPDGLSWEPLDSSHVEAMAYKADSAELFVQFKGGSVYRYPASQEEADGLRNADSPGRYVHFMLKQKGDRLS